MAQVLLGAPLLSSTAGASVTGLFGSAGVFSAAQTLATLGTVASFAAPVLSIASGIQQGNAADAAAKAQAQQLRAQADADAYNATVAQQNAKIVEGQTQAQLDQADRERRLRIGANIAAGGASGLSGGSASDIIRDNITQETLNLLTIQNEGLLRKREFETQGALLTSSSQNTRNQVPYVLSAGKQSKANAILGGVSKGISTGYSTGTF